MIVAALLVVFPLCMVFAAISDVMTMTIPNRVPLILTAGFLVLAPALGLPWPMIAAHLGVGLAALLITFGCFSAGWMGGGDAKLIAATAIWFGLDPQLLEYLLYSSAYGGALTLGLLAARTALLPATGVGFVDHLLQPKTGVPYGVALGAGGLTVYSSSAWVDMAVRGLG